MNRRFFCIITFLLVALVAACTANLGDLTPTPVPPSPVMTETPSRPPATRVSPFPSATETPSATSIAPTQIPDSTPAAPPPAQESSSLKYVISAELCEVTYGEVMGSPPGQQPLNGSSLAGDALLQRLGGQPGAVSFVAFALGGDTILTYSWGVSQLWDATTGNALFALQSGTDDRMGRPVVSPDGRLIAAFTGPDSLSLWDASTGRVSETLPVAGRFLAFSPDGRQLATGDWQVATLWDADTGQKLNELAGQIVAEAENEYAGDTVTAGHSGPVIALAFSPDGQVLLTGGADGTIRLWDLQDGRHLWCAYAGWIDDVSFSPEGRKILVTTPVSIRVWDAYTGRLLLDQAVPTLGDSRLTGIRSGTFGPDGASVLTAHGDATARIWDAATGELIGLLRHPQAVNHAAYDPAGQLIVTALGDDTGFLVGPRVNETWLWLADHPDHVLAADAQRLVDDSVDHALAGSPEEALATLTRAQALSPYPDHDLEREGRQWVARALRHQFQESVAADDVDAALDVVRVLGLVAPDATLSARDLRGLCHDGVLALRAAEVLAACDLSVAGSDPYEIDRSRDIRGVARAMTGDFAGAIEDFQFYIDANQDSSYYEDEVAQRTEWIALLQAGQNPFVDDVERLLRDF